MTTPPRTPRRWRRTASIAGTGLALTLLAAQAAPAHAVLRSSSVSNPSCPWVGSKASIDSRVAQVLAQMTLDEKIAMVHGTASSSYTGEIPGDARLCIPALKLQDGPVGVRMNYTTQLPAAADVAASFDPSVANSYGQVIGAEDKAKGADVDLGPTINIVRDPRWGRAFESYSEDPYLAGQIGAADINGIQSQGVMAQVKHFAVYNQETNRNTPADNAVIDDRAVHEIYTAAFGAIVANAHPSSAMCSYSSVNGTYACENAYLNTILKTDFGFDGFITSDWTGTHSTVQSANAGMDMEMPYGTYFGDTLKQAVLNGRVAQARVDDMVTRILREEFRFKLFEHPSLDIPGAYASSAAHVAVAEQAAEAGTVLLKNSGNILPLNASTLKSIAVIGTGAKDDTLSAGGGSATVAGTGTVTAYDGIKARAGSGINVQYAPGEQAANQPLPAVPASALGQGLTAQFYNNMNLSGTPVLTRTDANVDFNFNGASPGAGVNADQWSAKWTGTLNPTTTGSYTFSLTSDDGSRLFVNGQQIIDNWRDQGSTTETGTVTLTAGQPASIEVDYYQDGGGSNVALGWTPPGTGMVQQAADLAANSDVAIVYANDFETEGSDLTNIDLPGSQNDLIAAVAAANPNTIVVLNTGSAVTMPWLDKVKGVFEAWYPGQQAGNAIAALLFGDVNPSGKLPVTFPTSLAQVPANTAAQWPGVNGQVQYSEGLDVGYRWYDAKNLSPLFPFGYGLSYTTFSFSNLHLSTSTLSSTGTIQATVNVTNTGTKAGSEVAQLYLTDPASTGEPTDQLKGFQKVALNPGQTQQVAFTLHPQDASFWNTAAQGWTLAAGTYSVHVGDSSRSLPLSAAFNVAHTVTHGTQYTNVKAPTSATAGNTLSVTTTFTNGAATVVHTAATALAVPGGWKATATTPAAFSQVNPGQTVTTTWSVAIPATTVGGAATLSATTSFTGSSHHAQPTGSATVNVTYANLAAAYDTVAVTDDTNTVAGNFDGSGDSYSAQGLAAAGVTPGSTITAGTATFTWPNVPAGAPDSITASGQIIAMNGTGTQLSVLGAAANGGQTVPLTVTYTDGTTSTPTVTLADWWANQCTSSCTLVATSAHLNESNGTQLGQNVSVYADTVPLTPGKKVAYITLPSDQNLHLFAATIN